MDMASLACIANCVANDLKFIHLNAKGAFFDVIHKVAEDYYNEASDDYDLFAEMALECSEPIINPSNSCTHSGYIPSEVLITADKVVFFTEIKEILDAYILDLQTLVDEGLYAGDILNTVEERLRFWKKENNYKMNARLKESMENVK